MVLVNKLVNLQVFRNLLVAYKKSQGQGKAMSFVTILYAALFYFAAAILFIGLAYRVYEYAKIPAPLKIPTPPAPMTQKGVAIRIFREVVFFESLFSATKWTWLFSWIFHLALLLAAFRHLKYFTDPVWFWVSSELVQVAGHYAVYLMLSLIHI